MAGDLAFNLPTMNEAIDIEKIDINALLKPTITIAEDTIIKSVTNNVRPRLIFDFCSRYKANMCIPPNEAPEFNTKLTPTPINVPANKDAKIGVTVGKWM